MSSRLVRRMLFLSAAAVGLGAVLSTPAQAQSISVRAQVGGDSFRAQLGAFGRWGTHPTYGSVFYPARRDFVPYTYGRWEEDDQGANVWVSDEPHGWATEHYGRWVQTPEGWAWIPGSTYAPAWVAWGQQDDGVAWAPLGPDERACGEWHATYDGARVAVIARPRIVLRSPPRFYWRRHADAWQRPRFEQRRAPDRWQQSRGPDRWEHRRGPDRWDGGRDHDGRDRVRDHRDGRRDRGEHGRRH